MAKPYGLGIELSRRNFGFGSVCVRDWSGILCEPCGSGEREMGAGIASKDIAESPTA